MRTNLSASDALLHNIAFSDQQGERTFYFYGRNSETAELSSLYRRSAAVEQEFDLHPSSIQVNTDTLDAFCAEHNVQQIDFLKIDVEGAELDVLQGAVGLLQTNKIRLIQFESGDTLFDAGTSLREVLTLLSKHGYALFRILPQGLAHIAEWRTALENGRFANYLAASEAAVNGHAVMQIPEETPTSPPKKGPVTTVSSADKLVGIIFSKDRAMQLEATLRSFAMHCTDQSVADLKVLYAASSPLHAQQYLELESDYAHVDFVREKSFKEDLLTLMQPARWVLFLCDDDFFVRNFDLTTALQSLERSPHALGFSLRLGENTTYEYMSDQMQTLPEFEHVAEDILRYPWTEAELDFGYPLELGSSVYRVYDLFLLLNMINFQHPNTLEALLDANKNYFQLERNLLLCYTHSAAFSYPINVVQNVIDNRRGDKSEYSVEALAGLFADGYRIDVEAFSGFVPDAVHQEVELAFWKRKEAADLPAPQRSAELQRAEAPCISSTISIVILTYNRSAYLGQAIESALNQTYPADEILIIDDGSTDDTERVVERFEAARIRYIKKPKNEGSIAKSRNLAIREVQGDYILWLDDDDILLEDTLKKYVELLRADPDLNLIYGILRYFDDATGETRHLFSAPDWSKQRNILLSSLLGGCVIPNPASLVRKSLLVECCGYDEEFLHAEDYEFWTRAARYLRPKKLEEVVIHYRVHGNNGTSTIQTDISYDSKIARNVFHRFPLPEVFPDLDWEHASRARASAHITIAKNLFRLSDYYNARKYLEAIPEDQLAAEPLELLLKCLLCLEEVDDLSARLDNLEDSAHIDPEFLTSFRQLTAAYQLAIRVIEKQLEAKNIQNARTLIQEFVEEYGQTAATMLLQGKLYAAQGNEAAAFNLYKRAICSNPAQVDLVEYVEAATTVEQRDEIQRIRARLLDKDLSVAFIRPVAEETPEITLGTLQRFTSALGDPSNWPTPDVAAIEAALVGSEYLILLSPDIIVTKDWLDILVAVADTDFNIAAVGPTSNLAPGAQQIDSSYDDIYEGLQAFADQCSREHATVWEEVPFLGSFCLLLKSQALRQVGGFNTELPLAEAIWDAFNRLRESDFRLVCARGVHVHHYELTEDEGAHFDEMAIAEQVFTEQLERGNAALERADLEAALNEFEALTHDLPDLALAHAALGQTHLARSEFDRAATAFRRAVELTPKDGALRNQLGIALFQDGKSLEAESIFWEASALAPQSVDALLNLVELYRAGDNFSAAASCVKSAIELAPGDPDVLASFGALSVELGDEEAAKIALIHLREQDPEHAAVSDLMHAIAMPATNGSSQVNGHDRKAQTKDG